MGPFVLNSVVWYASHPCPIRGLEHWGPEVLSALAMEVTNDSTDKKKSQLQPIAEAEAVEALALAEAEPVKAIAEAEPVEAMAEAEPVEEALALA